jgi:hypothetical protein
MKGGEYGNRNQKIAEAKAENNERVTTFNGNSKGHFHQMPSEVYQTQL